jgi:hypothetical protein
MQQMLRVMIAAALAMVLGHVPSAATAQSAVQPTVKQIQLTEKHIQSFIDAQKDLAAVLEKIQGATSDQMPPQLQAELETAAKKHGFKDFGEYDLIAANITMVMAGIDPKTKAFTDPITAIKSEIAEVTADKAIPEADKKQMLEELNEALKAVEPIQFPGNIELVKKYYDKIDASLT